MGESRSPFRIISRSRKIPVPPSSPTIRRNDHGENPHAIVEKMHEAISASTPPCTVQCTPVYLGERNARASSDISH